MTSWRDRRVLVTGATGFLGSALAALLTRDGARVRALVRSSLGAEGLHRAGARLVLGDLGSPASLEEAVRDRETVLHCAYAPFAELEPSREANVQGALALLAAAAASGVTRFVHASSAAVHGEDVPPTLDEDHPYAAGGPVYTRIKIEIEQELLARGRELGVEVVVLRPTLIYGPGSWTWTTRPLNRLRYEELLLVDDGRGLANVVYVEDVAQAMARAALAPGVDGEAYLVSGPGAVTWRELLTRYAELLGKPAPRAVSVSRARRIVRLDAWRYRALRRPPRVEPLDLRMQTQRHVVSIDKARRALGYEPQFDLDRAMVEIGRWAVATRLQPSAPSF